MSPRLWAAIRLGRTAGLASRALHLGGGTSIAGLVAAGVHPGAARALAGRLPKGAVLVCGTNGKTTTSRLLASAAQAAGWRTVHNRAGANLMGGITAALLAGPADLGIFEVDEAVLPRAITELMPRLVLCLNLFRDQLDRYGEIDHVTSQWAAALATLPSAATVILNADDPRIAALGRGLNCRQLTFGLNAARDEAPPVDPTASAAPEHAADSVRCPFCASALQFEQIAYGHLGRYSCPSCGWARPRMDLEAEALQVGLDGTRFRLDGAEVTVQLPGLYNAGNAVAAYAAAKALDIPPATVRAAIAEFQPAFGRTELLHIGERSLRLLLAKNPVGCNEVLRTILRDPEPLHLCLALNDRAADGADVSWIWDVDFEMLAGRCRRLLLAGTRAEELALRLKYAGLPPEQLCLERDPYAAVQRLLEGTPSGGRAYAVPTYTALLDLHASLAAAGLARAFWDD
ncbi:MAG: MurT ligase domain-containing protein [Chloroflexota bacterium]